jgi:hypothetical protein
MSDLFVDVRGAGTPVVLVHGSLATGAEEWTEHPAGNILSIQNRAA